MQVRLSKIAKSTLQHQINFLEMIWTQKEIIVFLKDVKRVISDLENGKHRQYQKSFLNTRSALIGKNHVRIYFRKENKNLITILLFFDMRQDPQKIIDLLI